MELRQIERQHLRPPPRTPRQGLHRLEIRTRPAEPPHLLEHIRLARRRHRMQPQRLPVPPVMHQRVQPQIPIEIAMQIEPRIEPRRGIAPLAVAIQQIMLERIDPGRRHIGIFRQIERRIELRHRAHRPRRAQQHEMREQCALAIRRVLGRIPRKIEILARRPPLRLARRNIMQHRVHPGPRHIAVGRAIPDRIEIQARPPPLAPALSDEMRRRIDPVRGHIGIGPQIERAIEQVRRRQHREIARDRMAERMAHRPRLAARPQVPGQQFGHRRASRSRLRVMQQAPITGS